MERQGESPENHGMQVAGAALLERALDIGYPLTYREVPPELTNVYSERNRCITDAEERIRFRFDQYATLAQERGIPVPEFSQWAETITDYDVEDLKAMLRPERVRLQMLDGFNEFVSDRKLMGKLLEQQQDGMHAAAKFMESATRMQDPNAPIGVAGDGKSGYVDKPTGTGKTGLFIAMAWAAKMKESPDDPIKVLILTPTRNIQKQTIGDKTVKPKERQGFAKFWREAEVSEYSGDIKEITDLTVMTNASFNQLVQNGTMRPGNGDKFDFDLILVDESHTDLGENISASLRAYYGDKVTIGFSGTPDFHEEKRTAHLLEHEIFKLTLRDAVETGKLAPVTAEHRELILHFDERKLAAMTKKERRKAIEEAYFFARLERSIADIRKAVIDGNGVLVRCPPGGDTDFAKKAEERIKKEFVTTIDRSYSGPIIIKAVGGSKQQTKEQQLILKGFNKRRGHALSYVSLINMGTDLPPGKLFVDLWPMRASIPVKQGIGRVLRLIYDEDGRPIPAKVITYRDPDMEGQYSSRDALEMRPGEVTLSFNRPYRPKYAPPEEGFDFGLRAVATIGEVGRTALQHDQSVVYERPVYRLNFEDACDQFDFPSTVARPYLEDFGIDPEDELPEDDYATFFEMVREMASDQLNPPVVESPDFVEVDEQTASGEVSEPTEGEEPVSEESPAGRERNANAPPLPDTGYISIVQLAQEEGYRGSMSRYISKLLASGIPVETFRDADGGIGYYTPDI